MQTPLQPAFLQTPLIYGCMSICRPQPAPSLAPHEILIAAYETGFRLFDHAAVYTKGECEAAHARALRECPAMARDSFTTSKAGPVMATDATPHHYNSEPHFLRDSARASRDRLGVETIDLFLIHRFDPLLDPHAVNEVFLQLKEERVASHFGVSNYLPWQLEALRTNFSEPLINNQIRFHPGWIDPLFDGTLDHCLAHHILPTCWSPLGKGLYATDTPLPPDHPEYERATRIRTALDAVGATHGWTRTQTTLAWLRRHPARPIPVIGSCNPARIAESWQARDAVMPRTDWFRILEASRGQRVP